METSERREEEHLLSGGVSDVWRWKARRAEDLLVRIEGGDVRLSLLDRENSWLEICKVRVYEVYIDGL